MKQTEIERVFLVKSLPNNLSLYQPITMDVGDFYDPLKAGASRVDHLGIRRKGKHYEIRKKVGKSEYKKIEYNIAITKEEFERLISVATQRHQKNMYLYPLNNHCISEIDLYQGKLAGYARVEVEFKTEEEMKRFIPPKWFGTEITEINHSIHKNLGLITFDELQERYSEKGIDLKPVFGPKKSL